MKRTHFIVWSGTILVLIIGAVLVYAVSDHFLGDSKPESGTSKAAAGPACNLANRACPPQ
jgi:hypothetical protein